MQNLAVLSHPLKMRKESAAAGWRFVTNFVSIWSLLFGMTSSPLSAMKRDGLTEAVRYFLTWMVPPTLHLHLHPV